MSSGGPRKALRGFGTPSTTYYIYMHERDAGTD